MNLYLVGGGQLYINIAPRMIRGESLNLYLAGGESRVDLYLAGIDPISPNKQESLRQNLRPMILESFLQVNEKTVKFLPLYKSYMLDSGAFSMLTGKVGQKDLKQYVNAFADYIIEYKVDKYFELDIDPFIGYSEVRKIRDYLHKKTGVRPIPVWHKSRGIEDFKQMCKDYPYVAIGGYVSKEFGKDDIQHFPKLIRYAHQQGAKIHGLGFTALKWLPICHFDSVDSTAWLSGNRFGHVYKFNGKTMIKINKPDGKRVNNEVVAINNFVEWVKFQRYAEIHF